MNTLSFAAGALALSLMAGSAESAVLWSFEETGGNVVGTLSGSLDLTNAVQVTMTIYAGQRLHSFRATVVTGPASTMLNFAASGPASFGSGGFMGPNSWTGSEFAIEGTSTMGPTVAVSSDYGGGPLSGTITFAGTTLALLGVTPGSYVYTLPNDTVTVSFSKAAVIPLPATLPLLVGALGLVLGFARRGSRLSEAARGSTS